MISEESQFIFFILHPLKDFLDGQEKWWHFGLEKLEELGNFEFKI